MPFKIDRVPRGLLNLLNTRGGLTPAELEDRLRASLEVIQFYANTQLQQPLTTNGALGENAQLVLGPTAIGGPGGTGSWPMDTYVVLFSMSTLVTKTATMTAFQGSYSRGATLATAVNLGSTNSLQPFGATETGVVRNVLMLPYPRLINPNQLFFFNLDILGTDATAAVTFMAEIGLLG